MNPASPPARKIKPPPSKAGAGPVRLDRIVPVARIGAPHGVRGWVSLSLSEARPEVLEASDAWRLSGDGRADLWKEARVSATKRNGKCLLALLEGCGTRDDAEGLRGRTVGIERFRFPELPEGEYYWCDLTGLHVTGEGGAILGDVVRLDSMPSNDNLVVRRGCRVPLLIPFKDPYITEVDLERGVIRTAWRDDY